MDIGGLLEFYRKVRVKDKKVELCDRCVRGPTSMASVRGDLLYNRVSISPFETYWIVIYGIVSELHPRKSPKWKFEATKEIIAENHYATGNSLLNYLQRNSA